MDLRTPASFLRTLSFVAVFLWATTPAIGQFFTDNFSSYTVGGSMSPNWTPYYNGASVAADPVSGGSHGNTLYISSASNYAGYAFRAVSFAQEFRIEFDFYTTASTNSGPIIDMWYGEGATPLYRVLTLQNGNFYQGDAAKQQIGSATWTANAWHHMVIDYVRGGTSTSATVTYTYDGTLLGQITTPGSTPWDSSTHYFALANNNAGSSYFDNTSISAVPEPSTYAALAGAAALGLAVWWRRKTGEKA